MQEQALVHALEKLIESGALEQTGPGGLNFVAIGVLLILVMALSIRVFVVNGVFGKITECLSTMTKTMVEVEKHVQDIKITNTETKRKMSHILELVGDRRKD